MKPILLENAYTKDSKGNGTIEFLTKEKIAHEKEEEEEEADYHE